MPIKRGASRLRLAWGIAHYPEAIRAYLLDCVMPAVEPYELAEREYRDSFLIVWIDGAAFGEDYPNVQPIDWLAAEITQAVDELGAIDIDGELQ